MIDCNQCHCLQKFSIKTLAQTRKVFSKFFYSFLILFYLTQSVIFPPKKDQKHIAITTHTNTQNTLKTSNKETSSCGGRDLRCTRQMSNASMEVLLPTKFLLIAEFVFVAEHDVLFRLYSTTKDILVPPYNNMSLSVCVAYVKHCLCKHQVVSVNKHLKGGPPPNLGSDTFI